MYIIFGKLSSDIYVLVKEKSKLIIKKVNNPKSISKKDIAYFKMYSVKIEKDLDAYDYICDSLNNEISLLFEDKTTTFKVFNDFIKLSFGHIDDVLDINSISNREYIRKQYDWIQFSKIQMETEYSKSFDFDKQDHYKLDEFWKRKTYTKLIHFGIMYSVLEALKNNGIDIFNKIPELKKIPGVVVSSSFPIDNSHFKRNMYTILKMCRDATFHVPNKDLDRTRDTFLKALRHITFFENEIYEKLHELMVTVIF